MTLYVTALLGLPALLDSILCVAHHIHCHAAMLTPLQKLLMILLGGCTRQQTGHKSPIIHVIQVITSMQFSE